MNQQKRYNALMKERSRKGRQVGWRNSFITQKEKSIKDYDVFIKERKSLKRMVENDRIRRTKPSYYSG